MYQGDINIDPGLLLDQTRNGAQPQYRWPDRTIPYIMDKGFSDDEMAVIRFSLDYLEQHSCVRFVERTIEPNYVSVTRNETRCW